jgi:hypothetical protein
VILSEDFLKSVVRIIYCFNYTNWHLLIARNDNIGVVARAREARLALGTGGRALLHGAGGLGEGRLVECRVSQ